MQPDDRDIGEHALRRHLTMAGISCAPAQANGSANAGADVAAIAIDGQPFITRRRSLPDVPERLLEVLSLHVMRVGAGNATPGLLLITVQRLPRSAANWSAELRDAQQRLQSPAAWAILSRQGGCLISVPTLGDRLLAHDDQQTSGSAPEKRPRTHEPRSDVAMAVLKSIMLSSRPDGSGPLTTTKNRRVRESPPGDTRETITDLAARLGVSQAAAYNAVSDLIRYGWMRPQRGCLPQINDLPGIIAWWFDRRRHRLMRAIPVAPLYESATTGATQTLGWLKKNHPPTTKNNWAITGWTACALHQHLAIADASDKPIVLTVKGSARDLISAWSLREVPAHQAMFHLQKSPHPLTTFSHLSTINDLPVVDPWEAALDVVGDPQRGPEQAAAIADALFALA